MSTWESGSTIGNAVCFALARAGWPIGPKRNLDCGDSARNAGGIDGKRSVVHRSVVHRSVVHGPSSTGPSSTGPSPTRRRRQSSARVEGDFPRKRRIGRQASVGHGGSGLQGQRHDPRPTRQRVVLFRLYGTARTRLGGCFRDGQTQHGGCLDLLLARGPDVGTATGENMLDQRLERPALVIMIAHLGGRTED